MILCPKCNKQLDDGTKFCGSCGTQIFGIVLCPNCGNQMSTEFAFCPNCGSSIDEEIPSKEKPKKKTPQKLFLFGGIGVFVVAVVVMITLFYRKSSPSSDYAFYIKDNELFLTDFTTNNSRQIVSGIFADDFDFNNNDLVDYLLNALSQIISNLYTTSRNGELLFFIEEDDLYYKIINFSDVEKTKIDSNAYLYHVNDTGTLVTYLTDNVLYQYDIKQKEKELIAGNVSIFAASDDGHNIVYINNDDSIYVKYFGKETEMIDNGVSIIPYMTENLKTIYYIKDRSLYKKTDGSEKIKLSSDVMSVLAVYNSGEMYYTKSDFEDSTLYDFVQDDLEQTEKAELRVALAKETLTGTNISLCYFDGIEEKVITNDYWFGAGCASDLPVIAFKACKNVKLSEIDSIYDAKQKIESAHTQELMYVAIGDTVTVIGQSSANNQFVIDNDGKTIYFIDDIPEDNEQDEEHGNLYKVTIENGKVQKPELYDTNVFTARFLENGHLMYFKDYKYDMGGDLFVNKTKIDDNVSWLSVNSDQNGNLVYFTNWNSDNNDSEDYIDYITSAGYGTLNIYENGKVRKVADNVRKYTVLPSGNILYLCDYNRYKGELYIDKKGKIQKIDTDVVDLIPCLDSAFRMGGYYFFLQNADDVLS